MTSRAGETVQPGVHFLEGHPLEDYSERLFDAQLQLTHGIRVAGRFKPAAETYAQVAPGPGVSIGSTCLVAAHAWGTPGAQLAGGRAARRTP